MKNLRFLVITVVIDECRGRLFTRAKAIVGLIKIQAASLFKIINFFNNLIIESGIILYHSCKKSLATIPNLIYSKFQVELSKKISRHNFFKKN